MIEVSKEFPLPEVRKKNVYPYKQMDVGDSFFLENTKKQIVFNNNYRASKTLGMKFTARVEGDGVRVWRIE